MRTCPPTVFLLFGFLLVVCPTANAQQISALDPGRPVTRQLRAGERHSYSLQITANQAVEIRCTQMGVDVVITAVDTTGRTVTVSNAPPSFTGVERLFFISDTPGFYRIDVEVGRPGTGTGSYALSVEEVRPANENDAPRAEAMKLLGDTRGLLQTSEGRFERATQATANLDRAVALFEKADDRQGMANSLFHLGNIIGNEFGDEPLAIDAFEKALAIWRTLEDEPGKASCLAHAARELVEKGDHQKGLTFLNEALAINRKLNDPRSEAVTLSFLCRLYNNTQKFQEGFETCRESRRLGQDADPMSDYYTYSATAALNCNTGDKERCLELYNITVQRMMMPGSYLNPIRLATSK